MKEYWSEDPDALHLPKNVTETLFPAARRYLYSVRHLCTVLLFGTLLREGVGETWKALNVSR
jgi:hypothetical protein